MKVDAEVAIVVTYNKLHQIRKMENQVLVMAPNSKSHQMINNTTNNNIRNHLLIIEIVKNVVVPWILTCFKIDGDIVSTIWMYQHLPLLLMLLMFEIKWVILFSKYVTKYFVTYTIKSQIVLALK